MNTSADSVIEEIDAGTLRPMTHAVGRALHRHMSLDEHLQKEALAAFDRGDPAADMAALEARIWERIRKFDVAEQSGLRLSNLLARSDEGVDWHLAEYLISWAREQGLSEDQIIGAFHSF